MDSSKKFKQWKSFDFGPPTKKVRTTTMKPSQQDLISKEPINKKIKNVGVKNTFNFHDKLKPKTIEDLAVHPKKIQEVQEWFKRNVCQSNSNTKFLLLSGPTGSGKTATVSVMCKLFNISISEWVNPVDQEYEYKIMNQIDQFIEFLSESKYESLFESSDYRITLIKDFPNAVIQNPDQFFEILETCKYTTKQPVIFICTEVKNKNLNLQRTLFPDEILEKFNITHISFNTCAPTLMKIAFKRAQDLVKSNSDIFRQPSSKIIDAILASADGDIRNAMNQFHMASLLGSEDLPTMKIKLEEKTTKRKRSKEQLKLELMSKDQNLGIFHGLGRVLNPKRKPMGNSWRLIHNIETLIDEFSTQPQMFISFLFENYLKYFGSISDVSKSAEILSLSLKFLENWEKQETLVFGLWISVLGLMVFNEHRVSAWNQIKAPVRVNQVSDQNEWDKFGLNPTDYFYYNVIKKSDKYHKFNFNF